MSRTSMKYYFTIFVFALCITGCNLESLDEPIIVSNVEKEFHLDLWEALWPNSRTSQLLIETIEDEACQNYTIAYQFNKSGSTLELSLNEIVSPEDCIDGEAPASSVVDFGALSEGIYELNIDLKNTVFSKGQLTITEDYYTINMDTEEGIIFVRRELLRVPDDLIWGYVGSEDAEFTAALEGFLADLQANTSSKTLTAGYYGYFSINQSRELVYSTFPFPENQFQTFYYEYNGTEAELQEMIDNYRTTHGEDVTFKLYNAAGREF